MKIVEKPWGREIWVAHTDKYAFKIIEIKKGTRSSLQYHVKKHEHLYVDSGLLQMECGGNRLAESRELANELFRELDVAVEELTSVYPLQDRAA